jgi:hypothetical protein
MRMLMLVIALLGQAAAAQPPDTEVFLASLSVRRGTVEIGKPINISNNPVVGPFESKQATDNTDNTEPNPWARLGDHPRVARWSAGRPV